MQTIGESRLFIAAVLLEAGKRRMREWRCLLRKGKPHILLLFFWKISYMSNCGKVVGIYEWVCIVLCVIVWMVTLFAFCQGEHILLSSTHCCQNLGPMMRCAIVIPQRTGPFSSPAKFVKRHIWWSKIQNTVYTCSQLDLQYRSLKALETYFINPIFTRSNGNGNQWLPKLEQCWFYFTWQIYVGAFSLVFH